MADAAQRTPALHGVQAAEPRLPHESDEGPDGHAEPPRPVIEQARRDVESGMQDTDRYGQPGLEKPEKRPE